MIVNDTKENHLIDLVDVLIDDQAVEFVNEEVQLVLTLDLVMLLCEYLPLNL